jgi:nucleoid-associated protein YgaU
MVAAAFLSDLPVPKKNRRAGLRSADLSHTRTVRAGDTVPLLCQEVYGSPGQHAAVARANDLDSLRSVPPGRSLTFPPVEG